MKIVLFLEATLPTRTVYKKNQIFRLCRKEYHVIEPPKEKEDPQQQDMRPGYSLDKLKMFSFLLSKTIQKKMMSGNLSINK